VRVVADSHTILWYAKGSPQLSQTADDALNGAENNGGIVVSVATLIDLWYVTVTTHAVATNELHDLRTTMMASHATHLHPIDIDVADAYTAIDRSQMKDPWDRFIVATAKALHLPLVTRDTAIHRSGLIETIW